MKPLIFPPFLQKDDKILVCAPAGSFSDGEALARFKLWAEHQGWQVEIHPQTYASEGSLAGTDTERIQVLNEAFSRKDIRAVWAVRGGYGSIRIIDNLDFSLLKQHPKWLIGFSDITHFHLRALQEGIGSIHAIMPVQFKTSIPGSVLQATAHTLSGKLPGYLTPRDSMNCNERPVKGILTGGNASTLLAHISSCKTDFNGKILFLEDVSEHLYALDRIFRSLKRHGIFERISALILGHFTGIKQDNPPFPFSVKQIVLEAVKGYDLPVFFNFPAGHEPENFPLVFGMPYAIDLKEREWELKPVG